MKRTIFFIVLSLPLAVFSQEAYWQQQANFIIDVSLNDAEHTLDGFEKIQYFNNSPDSLSFIWFHLWPNAYKNDKTAFSEQLLVNNKTEFYFSNIEQRGYINRLDFKVNGITAKQEDHPQHIDIIKLILPKPLPSGQKITITTPFHVKLPYNFSRGGHVQQAYQVTQWYPKPAVYDRKGWHPMPYLDQGEFYSEFGDYDVRITIPSNYVVAATGKLQDPGEMEWLKSRSSPLPMNSNKNASQKTGTKKKKSAVENDHPASSPDIKTVRYLQNNVHDFAWFADKRFIVNHDSLTLPSGKLVDVFSYYLPSKANPWNNSIRFIKDAVLTRSAWLGEYAYDIVSAVEAPMGVTGGMEYPTITSISSMHSEKELDEVVAHEVSHNWLCGIIATNERAHPWMDEGMNTYYDSRYLDWESTVSNEANRSPKPKDDFNSRRIPENPEGLIFETFTAAKKDQPINTSSEKFTEANYGLVAYYKAGEWMKKLERFLGRAMFDSCMHEYYRRWQFKHPYPEDFKQVVETVSGKTAAVLFTELDKSGSLQPPPIKKDIRLTSFFNVKDTYTKNYISIAPAFGANIYDGFMVGAVVHNYQLPLNRFRFLMAPLYAFRSKKFNGLARASYSWYPAQNVYRVDVGMAAASFSMDEYQPEGREKLISAFRKIAPFMRVTFKERDALSKTERYIQFRSFFIAEDKLQFGQVINGSDTSYLESLTRENTNINQLKLVVQNYRALYPFRAEFNVEQHKDFVRPTFTGNYYFNYSNRQGGMNVRVFAGKFIYTGAKTTSKEFKTQRYHLNLTGPNGYEDYTYSNYFAGRNKFENWASQQIMVRDGAFKIRTDLLSSKVGKTDDWLVSGNFATDIPNSLNPLQVLPFKIPLKVFADIGTYADAWEKNAETGKALFDAGFQISLFREILNIYVPVLYSAVYRDYFRSVLGNKRFWKTISFSIDIQNVSLKKINRNIPF